MKICYRGNHSVSHSTEWHIGVSLGLLGHEVVRVQENEVDWEATVRAAEGCDLFLWTSTQGFAEMWPRENAYRALARLGRVMPTVGVHLDRWWSLAREPDVRVEPFHQGLGWLFTADGDSDHRWADAGIRHRWFPPSAFGPEMYRGTARDELRADVAFVGSWTGYGHDEWWPYRAAMLDACRRQWGERFRCFPPIGEPAVRGEALNDLYASVKVIVGDSCLADRSVRYWSDRVTETIGRGGFLVHPRITGLEQMIPEGNGVAYFPFGDHTAMVETVGWWLAHDNDRNEAIEKGMAHLAAEHTYCHRLSGIIDTLRSEGAWT